MGVIRVIRITSVKSSIGIITHQGHISKVSANAEWLTQSLSEWLSSLLERLVTLKKTFPWLTCMVVIFADGGDELKLFTHAVLSWLMTSMNVRWEWKGPLQTSELNNQIKQRQNQPGALTPWRFQKPKDRGKWSIHSCFRSLLAWEWWLLL